MAFPTNPVDGQQHEEAGRLFRWLVVPGVWESVGSAPEPEVDPIFTASASSSITNTDVSNWNEAYSWGDHALAGYLTQGGGGGSTFYYSQATPPVNPPEGALWYNTATEDFLLYRETSTNVFNWVPLSTGEGDSDTLDGGAY